MGVQKGFVPIALIIAVVMLVLASVATIKMVKDSVFPSHTAIPAGSNKPSVITPSAKISPTSTPLLTTGLKTKKTPAPVVTQTATPTVGLTPIPTSGSSLTSSSSDNSCPYDLSGPSGAIEVQIKPRSNMVVGDQLVELQAKGGCKVLNGRSDDKQTEIAKSKGQGYSSMNWVTYSAVPAGHYSVRIQYKGEWTGYTNVDAVSVQRKVVEFQVEGATSPPTPTPKPKPTCSVLIMPSSNGQAPFEASICAVNNANNPYQAVQQEFVDYDGNGSWDYQGAVFGCHPYTFQNPGSYTPKVKLIWVSGEESDVCQISVTVN